MPTIIDARSKKDSLGHFVSLMSNIGNKRENARQADMADKQATRQFDTTNKRTDDKTEYDRIFNRYSQDEDTAFIVNPAEWLKMQKMKGLNVDRIKEEIFLRQSGQYTWDTNTIRRAATHLGVSVNEVEVKGPVKNGPTETTTTTPDNDQTTLSQTPESQTYTQGDQDLSWLQTSTSKKTVVEQPVESEEVIVGSNDSLYNEGPSTTSFTRFKDAVPVVQGSPSTQSSPGRTAADILRNNDTDTKANAKAAGPRYPDLTEVLQKIGPRDGFISAGSGPEIAPEQEKILSWAEQKLAEDNAANRRLTTKDDNFTTVGEVEPLGANRPLPTGLDDAAPTTPVIETSDALREKITGNIHTLGDKHISKNLQLHDQPGGEYTDKMTSDDIKSFDQLPVMSDRGQNYKDYMTDVSRNILNGTYEPKFQKYDFKDNVVTYTPEQEDGSVATDALHQQKYAFLNVPQMWESLYANGHISEDSYQADIVDGNFSEFVSKLPQAYKDLYKQVGQDLAHVKETQRVDQLKIDLDDKIVTHQEQLTEGCMFFPNNPIIVSNISLLSGSSEAQNKVIMDNRPVVMQQKIDRTVFETTMKNVRQMNKTNLRKVLLDPESRDELMAQMTEFDKLNADYVNLTDSKFAQAKLIGSQTNANNAQARSYDANADINAAKLAAASSPEAIAATQAMAEREMELKWLLGMASLEKSTNDIKIANNAAAMQRSEQEWEATVASFEYMTDDAIKALIADVGKNVSPLLEGVVLDNREDTNIQRLWKWATRWLGTKGSSIGYEAQSVNNIEVEPVPGAANTATGAANISGLDSQLSPDDLDLFSSITGQ